MNIMYSRRAYSPHDSLDPTITFSLGYHEKNENVTKLLTKSSNPLIKSLNIHPIESVVIDKRVRVFS